MTSALRILIGLVCVAVGVGTIWLARLPWSNWSMEFMLWAWAFAFFSGAFAAWFYPWPSQLAAAEARVRLVELGPEQDSGIIEIVRDTRFSGALRKCGVLIDGAKVGEIGVAERLRARVSAGEHTVQARLSWILSAPHVVIVRRGEIKTAHFALPRLSEVDRAIVGPFKGSFFFQWW